MFYKFLTFTSVYCAHISISKYESPPTRWMTDGITIVGVTDGMCNIETSVRKESKWGAGITTAVYKANNIVSSLQNSNFKVISNPYYQYGEPINGDINPDSINAKIMFYYGDCKIVMKNESNINEKEYLESYSIVNNCANKFLYNSVESLDSDNKKNDNDKVTSEFVGIIIGSTLGAIVVLFILYLILVKICCNEGRFEK